MSDILKNAVDRFERNEPDGLTGSALQIMRGRRKNIHNAMTSLLSEVEGERRELRATEQRSFDHARTVLAGIDERIAELVDEQARVDAAAPTMRAMAHTPVGGAYTSSETYHRGASSPSFFRDLIHAKQGDANAADRLRRNNQEVAGSHENRALGNTGAVGGSGGEFAVPLWAVDDFVALARPGRITADLFHFEPLPPGIATVNLPKVGTGATTAIQTTQNTALSQTDLTTLALSSGISTIGGKRVVSRQLLDQSAIPFDRVVLEDLAGDYARQLGVQVISGTGVGGQLRGYLTPASTSVQTWTQASPTGGGFYAQLAALQAKIIASRYLAPDAISLAPRRWAWFASAVDAQGRPLGLPTGENQAFNAMGNSERSVAQGSVGKVLGMDVFIDPNIPINSGAGANQDNVLMFRRDDIWFWESQFRAEAFEQSYADSMGVLFRCFNYSALIPDRYLATLGQLVGTGLVTPTFIS